MGRWSWCSDFWDFDHDGYPDLYVANGYISAPERNDLASFFWRQVVGKSPDDATPALAYERGWQALNELIRSDSTWSGYERNVMFANNRDGTFSEVSGVIGLDFPEDGRSFALADIDHDGRLEVILKNRNAPQLRILHNAMKDIGGSISFRLRGHKSNRDAIGAAVTVEAGTLRQTKYLQAGSGFLAQHSKEMFFGLGKPDGTVRATIRWPSGLSQELKDLPARPPDRGRGRLRHIRRQTLRGSHSCVLASRSGSGVRDAAEPSGYMAHRAFASAGVFAAGSRGQARESFRSFTARLVLLNFWATTAPLSGEQLSLFHRHRSALAERQVKVVAINVDDAADVSKARSFAVREGLAFPVLFATRGRGGNLQHHLSVSLRSSQGSRDSNLLPCGSRRHDREGVSGSTRTRGSSRRCEIDSSHGSRAHAKGASLCRDSVSGSIFTAMTSPTAWRCSSMAIWMRQRLLSNRSLLAKPNDAEGYYNLGTLSLQRHDFPQARQLSGADAEAAAELSGGVEQSWHDGCPGGQCRGGD